MNYNGGGRAESGPLDAGVSGGAPSSFAPCFM